jgi:hypothetical protein
VLTEWDEFKDLDWSTIYDSMMKPAFVFDGYARTNVVTTQGWPSLPPVCMGKNLISCDRH